ncbi:MAG: proline--tRNA ligase, partial [Vampirovibrionia bacterium]
TTLRETPADAEVISHQLLVRAGFIRKLTSGIYNYLPLMWKVLKKVENIVREEMDAAGAQELLMPILQPAEIWEQSGRWSVYGKELMRLKDRHDRQCCLGPTHEEVITSVVKNEITTYKRLPVNLYQIQNKFRDEIRPRFGLLRGREFIMKDAYSFHTSQECLLKEYDNMAKAYTNIFKRCGLDTRMVQSDSGAIGGSVSHEFMVLTHTSSGESDVLYCDTCEYSANSNRAESILRDACVDGGFSSAKVVDTPATTTIEDLAKFLNIPDTTICKSMIYIVDSKPVLALIRGDQAVEEIKLMNAACGNEIRIASNEEVEEILAQNNVNSAKGFIGPKGLKIKVIADHSVVALKNFVVGCNETDKHLVGANWGVDIDLPAQITDIRLAQKGDKCPDCDGSLLITRGIEVGNIFQLGTKYSSKMEAIYQDENGKTQPFIMGCYGIGVSRVAASVVESFHDDDGIMWPMSVAPYHAVVIPVNVKDDALFDEATRIYDELRSLGIEVVLDDRKDRAGVKFKDADLIGFPIRITVGKTLSEGYLEVKFRFNNETRNVPVNEIIELVKSTVKDNIMPKTPELVYSK